MCRLFIRVNWEVFKRCTHGFDFAYPKRAPKLLVGQPQTFLMFFLFNFFCGFCIWFPLILSLAQLSKKSQDEFRSFFDIFHILKFSTTSVENCLLNFVQSCVVITEHTSDVAFHFSFGFYYLTFWINIIYTGFYLCNSLFFELNLELGDFDSLLVSGVTIAYSHCIIF